MRNSLFIVFLLFCGSLFSQELNCQVQVSAKQVEGSEKSTFTELQKVLQEFINAKQWTNDKFKQQEKIECSILINVTEQLAIDEFKATITVQSRRPIYGTTYNSTLLNYVDNDFQFKYVKFQTLEYSETSYMSELTAVVAFYVYYIIGLDYDSFAMNGGSEYFQKARDIVNYSQSSDYKGWKAFEGNENRYWLVENIVNSQFSSLRECYYNYHRLGFDIMNEKLEEGRAKVASSLEGLQKVHQFKPNSPNLKMFFNAKADEIVNLFSKGTPDEKTQLKKILPRIDPGNATKYAKIK